MLDFGSGPGTAALALAEALGNRPQLTYAAFDRAEPMLRKAVELMEAAIKLSLFHPASKCSAISSWDDVRKAALRLTEPIAMLLSASYFFASESLNVNDMCDVVMALKQNQHVKQLLLTYSNSLDERAGEKFEDFKKVLRQEFKSDGLKTATVSFVKNLAGMIGDATYRQELLNFKW
jgi:hypothetical protein